MNKTSQERFQRQEELASRLGFNDCQTLCSIEAGKRELTAEELR